MDPRGQGAVTKFDLQQYIDSLCLHCTPQHINLFMKRFDKDADGQLRYSEFCEAFLPTDPFHASLLAKKTPMQISVNDNETPFCKPTADLYRDVWRMHLDQELEIEKIRYDNRGTLCMREAFAGVDATNDGYVCKEDVSKKNYNRLASIIFF
jgi:hypothetical protein